MISFFIYFPAEGAFDSREGLADGVLAATEHNVFDRLIISESSLADKKMSPKAGNELMVTLDFCLSFTSF